MSESASSISLTPGAFAPGRDGGADAGGAFAVRRGESSTRRVAERLAPVIVRKAASLDGYRGVDCTTKDVSASCAAIRRAICTAYKIEAVALDPPPPPPPSLLATASSILSATLSSATAARGSSSSGAAVSAAAKGEAAAALPGVPAGSSADANGKAAAAFVTLAPLAPPATLSVGSAASGASDAAIATVAGPLARRELEWDNSFPRPPGATDGERIIAIAVAGIIGSRLQSYLLHGVDAVRRSTIETYGAAPTGETHGPAPRNVRMDLQTVDIIAALAAQPRSDDWVRLYTPVSRTVSDLDSKWGMLAQGLGINAWADEALAHHTALVARTPAEETLFEDAADDVDALEELRPYALAEVLLGQAAAAADAPPLSLARNPFMALATINASATCMTHEAMVRMVCAGKKPEVSADDLTALFACIVPRIAAPTAPGSPPSADGGGLVRSVSGGGGSSAALGATARAAGLWSTPHALVAFLQLHAFGALGIHQVCGNNAARVTALHAPPLCVYPCPMRVL